MTELPRKITDDPYGAAALIRRLIAEQGLQHWRRYAVAFALMAISAGATAASAWLLGAVINETYVNRSIHGIVMLSLVIIVLFAAKGARLTAIRLSSQRSATPFWPRTSAGCSPS
jgi:ATP-binding cassette subfamily B protein